ncbi:hypothetical protein [Agromyces sp. C10]|uniref:hypothetical protein n=1 Tax=Agromyces sp. C10 TaxID=2935077 RepID=UPI00200B4FC4|nr:hypothetical protein [Agromyces sp. C10]MCK8608964.1 hypothetical protein [Agromyces sp. C10]
MSGIDVEPRRPDAVRYGRWAPRVRWRLLPWWGRVIVVYAASRLLTTVFVMLLAREQGANPWTGAQPGYFEYANIWDSRWYQVIAAVGYPTELPRTDGGHVAENAWAFLPVFPGVVRLFTAVGVPWDVAAVLVALSAGLGAALVFHRLMSRFLEPDQAMFAVVLFCVAPVAPIMQFGYAESLGFLWLAIALLLLVDRRYGWLVPVLAVWAFTRPGALAFALTLGLHWIVRWATRRRDPFPVRERIVVASVAAFAGVVGLAWPGIAWAATGSLTAYTDTELAWRSAYIGYVELVPLTPWFQSGEWWLGQPMGTIVPIALVIAFGLAIASPWVKRLGVDIRLWLVSYALYVFAVFFPQSSTFRILAPLFPMAGALAVPRSPWWRGGLVLLFLALQVGWLLIAWGIDGRDWTPP